MTDELSEVRSEVREVREQLGHCESSESAESARVGTMNGDLFELRAALQRAESSEFAESSCVGLLRRELSELHVRMSARESTMIDLRAAQDCDIDNLESRLGAALSELQDIEQLRDDCAELKHLLHEARQDRERHQEESAAFAARPQAAQRNSLVPVSSHVESFELDTPRHSHRSPTEHRSALRVDPCPGGSPIEDAVWKRPEAFHDKNLEPARGVPTTCPVLKFDQASDSNALEYTAWLVKLRNYVRGLFPHYGPIMLQKILKNAEQSHSIYLATDPRQRARVAPELQRSPESGVFGVPELSWQEQRVCDLLTPCILPSCPLDAMEWADKQAVRQERESALVDAVFKVMCLCLPSFHTTQKALKKRVTDQVRVKPSVLNSWLYDYETTLRRLERIGVFQSTDDYGDLLDALKAATKEGYSSDFNHDLRTWKSDSKNLEPPLRIPREYLWSYFEALSGFAGCYYPSAAQPTPQKSPASTVKPGLPLALAAQKGKGKGKGSWQPEKFQVGAWQPEKFQVYISGLMPDITDTQLRECFTKNGVTPVEFRIIRDKDTQKAKGFAFADFSSRGAAQSAVEKIHGKSSPGSESKKLYAVDADANRGKGRSKGNDGGAAGAPAGKRR